MPAWAPLAATCLGQSMVVLDATIVNVALPAMRRGRRMYGDMPSTAER